MAKEKKTKETYKKAAKSTNYPVGDFLVRVKNAAIARNKMVEALNTKLVHSIAKSLERAGYLTDIDAGGGNLNAKIVYKNKEPLLMDIKLVSRPGARIYMGVVELKKIKSPKIFIISTPSGVLTTSEAIKKNVGGEIIAEVL